MKFKSFLLIAGIMAFGIVASANDHPFGKEQKAVKEYKASFDLQLAEKTPVLSTCISSVERLDLQSLTIIYAEVVLPGNTDPVIPVSHAPPEVRP